MNRDFYINTKNMVRTPISGGRYHFATRPRYLGQYFDPHTCTYGETYYGLADTLLGSDKLWDILADVNLPIHPTELYVGLKIQLPKVVVEIENTDFTVL